jgi:hypothetical protein
MLQLKLILILVIKVREKRIRRLLEAQIQVLDLRLIRILNWTLVKENQLESLRR